MPSKHGVYLFLDKKSKVLYVGKAKNLQRRVNSYFVNSNNLLEKTRILVSQVKKIKGVIVGSEIQALLLEANYIKLYKPKYNAKLTDDKAYPLIRITMNDKYPKILIARRNEDKKSIYFGPFPNSTAPRLVLRTIRRIFPFQSVVNHPNKLCLYNHLGLCPCPGVTLLKDTPYVRSILAKVYRKNINHIIDFLNGNTKKVINNLEKERSSLSKLEEFEKAEVLQRKIDAINYVTSPLFEKFNHKINPNLDEDLRYKELQELKICLLKHNVQVKNLERIECFDISNISGTNATGSMVVFINGEKDSSQYRRFKIKNLPNFPASPAGRPNLPNDFAMMQQVIQRRLNHKEWPFPDLIIVDGGKGQVSAAMNAISAMKQLNNETMDIPIIGLTKREETIIIPSPRPLSLRERARVRVDRENFVDVSLPKDSPALHLVMRIRDEAHRFAITYHRRLRSKQLLSDM